MKICIVPTMFPKFKGDYYGSFVFDEAVALVNKGYQVHVVTQHNPGIPYEETIDGVHVHRFKWLEPKKFKALVHFKGIKDNIRLLTYFISLFLFLIQIIRKYDIDIIHAHSTIPTGLIGVLVSRLIKKPVFITAHGMDVNNFMEHTLFKRLITYSLSNSDKVIAVSKDLKGKMTSLGINPDKIKVLRNGVDTGRFKPTKDNFIHRTYDLPDDTLLILFVGYMDTFKGIFELEEAFSRMKDKNVALIMVGEGPKKADLEKKVLGHDLKEQVVLTGAVPREDIDKYYKSADIFVLPSHSEGIPLVILEAMASGLPVIATNVGGLSEVVDDGENGFLIHPKDVENLATKLERLIDDPRVRERLASNSVKIMENEFSIQGKIEKLTRIYEKSGRVYG